MLIKCDLNQPSFMGLNEELRCTGFKPVISLEGEIIRIDFFYSSCVKGLDGRILEVSSFVETYTDENKRDVVDVNGDVVMETIDILDNEGNIIGTEDVPKKIGVIQFWKESIGNSIILPDLQVTLDSLKPKHLKYKAETLSFFTSMLKHWIKPLWGDTGYNDILKMNKNYFDENGVPNYANLILSNGLMEVPVVSNIAAILDGIYSYVDCSILTPLDATYGQTDSTMYCMLINETTNTVLRIEEYNTAPNSSNDLQFTGISFEVGDVLGLYFAIENSDETQISNTVRYTITVA